MGKLTNRVAVVTGGAQGIGAEIVKRLLGDGAMVVALDVNVEKLGHLAEEIDPSGEKLLPMPCNVADGEAVKAVFEKIYEKLGKVDILINNAGITRDSFFHKMSKEQWDTVIDVNLTSMFHTCQAVIPKMRQQEYGKIVNISSVSSWGNLGQANYSASKAGVLGLTRTLAKENGSKNITVNCPRTNRYGNDAKSTGKYQDDGTHVNASR